MDSNRPGCAAEACGKRRASAAPGHGRSCPRHEGPLNWPSLCGSKQKGCRDAHHGVYFCPLLFRLRNCCGPGSRPCPRAIRGRGRCVARTGGTAFQSTKVPGGDTYCQSALALGEQSFGPDDVRLARLNYGLALLHDVQGQNAEAEPLYQRALALLETARGPDHVSVARVLDAPRRATPASKTSRRG
jgi:Tetratricopeptide repeat